MPPWPCPAVPCPPALARQGLPQHGFYVCLRLLTPANVPLDIGPHLAQAVKVAQASSTAKERFRKNRAKKNNHSSKKIAASAYP